MMALIARKSFQTARVLWRAKIDYDSTYSKQEPKALRVDKSLLSKFYKSVHPDLFTNAPEEVKVGNARAVQEVNSYIQNIDQNMGVSLTKLQFYVLSADKEYKRCNVELHAIKANSSNDLLKIHMRTVIDTLNRAVAETQKEETKDESTFEQSTNPAYTIKYNKQEKIIEELDRMQDDILIKNIMKRIPANQAKHRALNRIQKSLYTVQDNSSMRRAHPILRYLVNSTDYIQTLDTAIDHSLDLSFVYFARDINKNQAKEAMGRLNGEHLQESERYEQLFALRNLSQDLYLNHPAIYFLISKDYSLTELDGFLSVPYKMHLTEMIQFYNDNKEKARMRGQFLLDKATDVFAIRDELQHKYKINVEPKDEKVHYEDLSIGLKHLRKLIGVEPKFKSLLQGLRLLILGKNYKYIEKKIIEVPIYFNNDFLHEMLLNAQYYSMAFWL